MSKKGTTDKKGWQEKAAATASAVAFEMLHKLRWAKPLTTRQAKVPSPALLPKSKKANRAPVRRLRQDRAARAAAPAAEAPVATPFMRMPYTLNEGAFYVQGDVLARVGVRDVDEVQFSFQEAPDGFIRVIPRIAKPQPIPNATLLTAARNAPLLKHRRYGGFTDMNKYGAFAYDPGGPHRGGPAPLAWGTQLFPNGELWLASNTVVVRERSDRPQWVPIPFIPALVLEQTFYQNAHGAAAFAVSQLGLKFPADIEFGVLRLGGVQLAVQDQDIRGPIRLNKIISPHELKTGSAAEIDQALVDFFDQIYNATGFARAVGQFYFPPGPPRL